MDQNQAQSLFRQASSLFASGDHKAALSILQELAKAFPANAQVASALTRCREALAAQQTVQVPDLNAPIAFDTSAIDDLLGPTKPKAPTPQPTYSSRKKLYIPTAIAAAALTLIGSYYLLFGHKHSPNNQPSQPAQVQTIAKDVPITASSPPPEPDFDINKPFNLEEEVRRVMQDPKVPDITQPQWQRDSYQAVIDIARAKRLSHGNPYETGVGLPPF